VAHPKTYGTLNDLPTQWMMFFPFVEELAREDKTMIPTIIERYFFKTLGSSQPQCFLNSSAIRSAYGNIASTLAGKSYTHIFLGIDVALRSQTMLFVLIEHQQYQGFVLCGARYTIAIGPKVYEPSDSALVRRLIESNSSHTSILGRIAQIFTDINPAQITSMRHLSKMVNVGTTTRDMIQDVKPLLALLKFPQPFWTFNYEAVQKALLAILGPDEDMDNDEPMHYSAVFSNDKVFQVLSAFGFQAPIFSIPGTTPHPLARNIVPSPFVIRLSSLEDAVANFKHIVDTGVVRNGIRSKGKSFTEREFVHIESSTLWGHLQNVLGVVTVADSESISMAAPVENPMDDF